MKTLRTWMIGLSSYADDISTSLTTDVSCAALGALVLKIFVPCYSGQELMDSSKNISKVLFHSQWYEFLFSIHYINFPTKEYRGIRSL